MCEINRERERERDRERDREHMGYGSRLVRKGERKGGGENRAGRQ